MWKLLKGLITFVVKWIPRFVKRFFSFWKYLFIKIKKTGPITILMYAMANIAMSKYWDILLEGLPIPPMMIDYPALFFTTYIFWTQTRGLAKAQKQIVRFIIKKLKIIRFFFISILGMPNTNLFTARMPIRRRLALLYRYIKTNLPKFLLRLVIFLFLFKIFLTYGYENLLVEGLVNLKDFLLFPIVIIKFLLQAIF